MSNYNKTVKGYRLDVPIGSGGFGTVYHAYQEVLNREVAVKVIKDKFINDPQFIRQFESEARIIGRLEHFNIVTLYDYWRDPSGAYLVMRWLRGGSLRGYLKQSNLTVPQVVRVLNQIASALAFAHRHNVIHRDIKPENILLDNDGNAFLTDFGIAVDLQNQDDTAFENISFGSPDYVAPEQLREKIITSRSDIYSLGIMLYELLAHERPFIGADAKEIMKMQLFNPVPSLRLKRPDLPTEIDTIIWQSTAKSPAHRYENVLELALAFQNIALKMDTIPESYLISTQVHTQATRTEPPKPDVKTVITENLATGVLATENLGENSDTGADTDDMATGVLVEYQGKEIPEFLGQIDTIADASQTNELENDIIDTPVQTDEEVLLTTPVQVGYSPVQEVFETSPLENLSSPTLTIEGESLPNPYKGLRPFEETDEKTFFGREIMVNHLIQDFENKYFLALIGPSGSGKSSLVRAGIIPALRRGEILGSREWFYSTMIPSDDPFRELTETLLRVAIAEPENWRDMLLQSEQGLHELLQQILPDDGSKLFLFIDQFEEVFTLGEDEDAREKFLSNLWYALNQENSRLRLIITLRADFYDRPLHYPEFGQMLKDNTEVVLPLNLQELEAAILSPAEQVGLLIDPALTNAILNDVHNQSGALPLLQYALTELYERRQGQRLGYNDYVSIGGISGALAQRAHEIFFTHLNESEQVLARQLFLRLVSIDTNGTATRRRLLWSEMMSGVDNQDMLENIVNAFSQHRLLTIDRDQATRSPTVEIAHEALIGAWERLQQWIEQNRSALQKRQELGTEVDRWLSHQQDKSYLAVGTRLIEFEGLLDNTLLSLRPEEKAYISSSIAIREAEEAREKRTNLLLRVFSGVIFGLFILALFSFFNANDARNDAVIALNDAEIARGEAELAAEIAQSRELASSSLANEDQNDLSLLLAVEALSIGDTYEAENSLLLALQENPLTTAYLHGHNDTIRAVDFDNTGHIAVSSALDNTIIRWDMTSNSMIGMPLTGHEFGVNDVEISPDNRLIASASADRTVRLWDLDTGEGLITLEGHSNDVWAVAFSADSTLLASAGEDSRIIIWDTETGEIIRQIDNAHESIIYTLDFSADMTRLVSGGNDNLVRLWQVASGEEIATIEGHTNWVRVVKFDPSGNAIISSGLDATLRFWDAFTGEQINEALNTEHLRGVYDFDFSFDSQFLATAGSDGRVIIWDLAQRDTRLGSMNAHNNRIWGVAFSPVDYSFLSASEDNNLIRSQLTAIERPGSLIFNTNLRLSEFEIDSLTNRFVVTGELTEESNSMIQVWDNDSLLYDINVSIVSEASTSEVIIITDLALSSDGLIGAVALTTGEVLVWDMPTGDILWVNHQHMSIVKDLDFTPDDSQLFSADEAGVFIIWDVATGNVSPTNITADSAGVTAMAISPDGQYLAIGGREYITIWDIASETVRYDALSTHTNAISVLLFDPQSEYLFSGSRDRSIIQWDVETGNEIQTFTSDSDWILSLAISPQGEHLVSGDLMGAMRIWDLASGRLIGDAISSSSGWLTALHFIDETTVQGSNRDNQILIEWTLDTQDWANQACSISNRQLSEREWEQFLSAEVYAPSCAPSE
ncbi:MAG: hypothetical protein Phog2KO_21020 [Phototrophicaceae bacterium]